jgi:hypothetical protein
MFPSNIPLYIWSYEDVIFPQERSSVAHAWPCLANFTIPFGLRATDWEQHSACQFHLG